LIKTSEVLGSGSKRGETSEVSPVFFLKPGSKNPVLKFGGVDKDLEVLGRARNAVRLPKSL